MAAAAFVYVCTRAAGLSGAHVCAAWWVTSFTGDDVFVCTCVVVVVVVCVRLTSFHWAQHATSVVLDIIVLSPHRIVCKCVPF